MNTNQLLALLCELLLKSALILLAASLIQRAWIRASAAQRHLVWCAAITAILLLPLTRFVAPRWEVPIVRVSTSLPERVNLPEPTVLEATPFAQLPATPIEAPRWRWPDWRVMVATIWAVGAVALLAARLFGSGRLLWLRVSSPRIEDSRLLGLAAEVFHELSVRRPVALRLSSAGCVPLTWGTLRPVLMLPAEALEWSDARMVAALRHEAGHIVRGDHFTRWLAHLACALYWPNPLVWVAARRLRTEQEQATDDLVLRAGTPADEYAAQLFEVARTLAARRGLAQCAVAMASPSTLEQRMLAIVDERRDRRPLSLRAVVGGVLTVALTFGLATAAQLQAQDQAAPSTPEKAGDPRKQQIMIEARFVEVTTSEGEPEAISEWLGGVLIDSRNKTEEAAAASSSLTAGLPTVQGIITPPQLQTVLRALSQRKGVDVLATPRVTTISGQAATIEIVREIRYATAWNKEGKKWAPKAFETRKAGVTLAALAAAEAGGPIDLQVTPSVVELVGFFDLDGDQNPPPDPADTITQRDQAGRILKNDQPGRRMQPVFSERKLTSAVSIFPGQTVVIGGMKEAAGTTFADTPAGGKKKLTRQFLVFVTANLIKEKPAPAPAVAPKPEPQPAAAASVPSERAALDKAAKIILPRVEFREATVAEAVAFLRAKAVELDAEKTGVNLVLTPGATADARLTLSLTNIPLSEALRYVASLAGLELVAEPNAIVLRGPKAEAAPSQAQATAGEQSLVVTSDEATFDRASNTAEFKGNVEIKQDNNVITGEKVKIQTLPETPGNGPVVEGRAGVDVRQSTPLDRVIPRRPGGN